MRAIRLGLALGVVSLGWGQATPEPPERRKTLFEQVVAKPTMRNGYEYYVRAADVIYNDEYRAYDRLVLYNQEQTAQRDRPPAPVAPRPSGAPVEATIGNGPQDIPPLPPGLTYNSTKLEILRAKYRRFGSALDLVAKGNGFPTSDPRVDPTLMTLYPELAGFRTVARFAVDAAYVQMAEGNTRAATSTLVNALTMARRIQCSTLTSLLVGRACEAILLAAVNTHIDRFSLEDVRRVGRFAVDTLAAPDPVFLCLEFETQFSKRNMADMILNPERMESEMSDYVESVSVGDDEEVGGTDLMAALKALPRPRREALVNRVNRKIDANYRESVALFRKSEREWLPQFWPSGVEAEADSMPTASIDEAIDGAMEQLGLFGPGTVELGPAMAIRKAQLRLLRLHAWVLERRWLDGKLPDDLKGAGDWASDPLSGASFEYEVSGANRYRLFSKGHGTLGMIELVYQRPKMPMPPESIDPVPPLLR